MKSVLLALAFFSFLQFAFALNCPYRGNSRDKPPFTVKFVTHNSSSHLSQTVCDLFSYIAELSVIEGSSDAIEDETYCDELDEAMKKSSAKSVVVYAVETKKQIKPCKYRAQIQNPVLLQITNASREEFYGTSSGHNFLELWLDSRFGEVRVGPLVFLKKCTEETMPKATSEHLVDSFRLTIHLALQSSTILLSNLNPPLKIVKEEDFNEAWINYRNDQASNSKDINVSWIYAIFLLVLTIYGAILVFLPNPDHKVFVQFDCLPEKQTDSEASSSGAAPTDAKQVQTDKDEYMPLNKFLGNKL